MCIENTVRNLILYGYDNNSEFCYIIAKGQRSVIESL
jgi:hypothetical protein